MKTVLAGALLLVFLPVFALGFLWEQANTFWRAGKNVSTEFDEWMEKE